MKILKPVLFVTGILCAAAVIFLGISILADGYLDDKNAKSSNALECSSKGATHTVIIKNDEMSPTATIANRCDTLVIVNNDDKLRKIGLGVHDKHVAYNGVTEKNLEKDQSLTIVLNKTGTFVFHDHFQDEVSGSFTVN